MQAVCVRWFRAAMEQACDLHISYKTASTFTLCMIKRWGVPLSSSHLESSSQDFGEKWIT
jgi:hypothetical protein